MINKIVMALAKMMSTFIFMSHESENRCDKYF